MTMSSRRDRPPTSPDVSPTWKIKLLYDGDCPLCLREVNFLQRRDAGRGLICFVNIAAKDYTPAEHGGIPFEAAMGRIHAILPEGTVIRDVEVFRRIYSLLGLGWVYAPTRWPLIGPLVDRLYALWARWRLKLTGRPDLATLVAQRQAQPATCQTDGRCAHRSAGQSGVVGDQRG